MGKNTSSKEFPTPVESRDRKDKKVNEKNRTNKKIELKYCDRLSGDHAAFDVFLQYDHELFPA